MRPAGDITFSQVSLPLTCLTFALHSTHLVAQAGTCFLHSWGPKRTPGHGELSVGPCLQQDTQESLNEKNGTAL